MPRFPIHVAIALALALAPAPARAQEQPSAQPPSGQMGLEMRLVAVHSQGGVLATALRPFEQLPTGIGEETDQRLRKSGLRAVSVPVDALQETLGDFRPVGPIQNEWIGILNFWSPIVTGPLTDDPFTRFDTGEVNLGEGRFRLLARCWIVPDLTDTSDTGAAAAALRLELVPQHVDSRRRGLQRLLEPRLDQAVDAGLVLHRLRLTCDLRPERALVIIPVAPGEWEAAAPLPESAPATLPDRQVGPDPDAPAPPPPPEGPPRPPAEAPEPAARPQPAGPFAPSAPTLGEQLLRSPGGTEEGDVDGSVQVFTERSVVVVLIAHTPARYKLLP